MHVIVFLLLDHLALQVKKNKKIQSAYILMIFVCPFQNFPNSFPHTLHYGASQNSDQNKTRLRPTKRRNDSSTLELMSANIETQSWLSRFILHQKCSQCHVQRNRSDDLLWRQLKSLLASLTNFIMLLGLTHILFYLMTFNLVSATSLKAGWWH